MFPAPPDAGSSRGLPELSADERAHAVRMLDFLRRTIAEEGGWMSFADYMSAVLYAPGLGYYASGTHKLGAAGDFVTAPELSPLFGHAVAAQLAQALAQVERGELIELGPGSGRLCAEVLASLAERDALPARYWLLEVSPDLRERQRAHLNAGVPEQ
jgi:SAM-dependent MidA family methyltransferase